MAETEEEASRTRMSKVAIIGSCITRDLWPTRGDAVADVLYVSRTSLPSLFAPPVRGFRPKDTPPPPLRRHQHNAAVADLQKTALARLVSFQPTHLVIDLIDERFDLLSVGGTLATHSWELQASGYLAQRALRGARRIPRLSAGAERLWIRGAEEFAALVRATPLRHATVVLHVSRWAVERQDRRGGRRPLADVEVLSGEPASIADHNALLARYERVLEALMPPMARVDVPEHRIADEAHPWGLSPFHFVPAYYEEVWRQLQGLGVTRPPAIPAAAPSAPAA